MASKKIRRGKYYRKQQKKQKMILCFAICTVVVLILTVVISNKIFNKKDENGQAENNTVSVQQAAQVNGNASNSNDKKSSENTTANTQAKDTTSPVITGVTDKKFELGEKILYMTGVSASDEVDGEVEVEVNTDSVDTSKAGVYTVEYSAVDKAGNKAVEKATIEIIQPQTTPAQINTLSQAVSKTLSEITDSSMSMGEKLNKIYTFAHTKIGYGGRPLDGVDSENEAYKALTSIANDGSVSGDCFTYCSTAKALLDGIGAKTIWVDNYGATTGDHSWVLCNVGTGWYHFDATRIYDGFKCFMLTDEELQSYMDRSGSTMYKRIESDYPATATTSFSY